MFDIDSIIKNYYMLTNEEIIEVIEYLVKSFELPVKILKEKDI